MIRTLKLATLFLALGWIGGCASIDAQDRFVLGEATRANRETQSTRDIALPNTKTVDTVSGVRAAKAVQALNERQTGQVASAGSGGAE